MAFKEHNNRKKADKFAEYITGEALRKYVADKVLHYVGANASVFDGAAGSGQLEQFICPREFEAVEVQSEASAVLQQNYPNATVNTMSFFLYQSEIQCDCVVMNPPFSMKFKALSNAEQNAIQAEFPWKKSGVVDDIFVLKGLNYSSRWGFFILFPGVGYRNTEKMFRALIGNQIVELNRIQNAFEDTQIDVLFLVIDKTKTDSLAQRELFDCKTNQCLVRDEWQIKPEHWEQIQLPQPKAEPINPLELEHQARQAVKQRLLGELRFSKAVTELEGTPKSEFNHFCDELCVLVQGEKYSEAIYGK